MKITFKIHFLFYFVALICFLSGLFKDFIYLFLIVIIHELGHILGGILFKWKIEKVIILPFGGITIFKESLNKPLLQELIITVLGPLFQMSLFIIKDDVFVNYNKFILLFNLLPLVPLDGSKIINIISNMITSFYYSKCVTNLLTVISIVLLVCLKNSLLFYLIIVFIVKELIVEHFKLNYYLNKFLLERYLYNFSFKKIKKVKNEHQFKKGQKHLIKTSDNYITEKTFLRKIFDKSY